MADALLRLVESETRFREEATRYAQQVESGDLEICRGGVALPPHEAAKPWHAMVHQCDLVINELKRLIFGLP